MWTEDQVLARLIQLTDDAGQQLREVVFNSERARDAVLRNPTDAFLLARVMLREFIIPRLKGPHIPATLEMAVFRFGRPGDYILSFRPAQKRLRIFDRGAFPRVDSALLIWAEPDSNGRQRLDLHVRVREVGSTHAVELNQDWIIEKECETSQDHFGWIGYDTVSGILPSGSQVSESEAQCIASDYIRSLDPHSQLNLVILPGHTISKPWGWIYFYSTKEFAETGDMQYALGGNGPVVVERQTGMVSVFPTNQSVEVSIRQFESSRWSKAH